MALYGNGSNRLPMDNGKCLAYTLIGLGAFLVIKGIYDLNCDRKKNLMSRGLG